MLTYQATKKDGSKIWLESSLRIARDAFGTYKRGSSVLWFEKTGLHSGGAVRDYDRWLKRHWRDFLRRGTLPPERRAAG